MSLDSQCHRLVEFLSELGRLALSWSSGLLVVLDELQQLLGPLDARSVIQFREFVWGLRTEQSSCGIVVCLDAMLEARLARWAADLLHRIRESGPTLQLTEVYTREFPSWLWDRLTTANGKPVRLERHSLSPDVMLSLGQFVERPDLANGPRTVVDVFSRAIDRFRETGSCYDITNLVADLHDGVFRYFGEGSPVQKTLTELLKDDWLRSHPDRVALIRTLAAFPRGCPADLAAKAVGSPEQLARARNDLFGPLLLDLPEGLALERLQQVRRLIADWEYVLARCWDTLPAQDSLLAHAPDMVWRILATRLFPEVLGSDRHWERISDDSLTALTGWRFLRGAFDEAFPQRDVGLWVGTGTPATWPEELDLAIALVCDPSPTGEAIAQLDMKHSVPRLTVHLPLLRPLVGYVPAELERYRKYLEPEPFRALTVIAAVHELEAVVGREETTNRNGTSLGSADLLPELRSFLDISVTFLLGEVLQGYVNLGPGNRVKQRGARTGAGPFLDGLPHEVPGVSDAGDPPQLDGSPGWLREGSECGISFRPAATRTGFCHWPEGRTAPHLLRTAEHSCRRQSSSLARFAGGRLGQRRGVFTAFHPAPRRNPGSGVSPANGQKASRAAHSRPGDALPRRVSASRNRDPCRPPDKPPVSRQRQRWSATNHRRPCRARTGIAGKRGSVQASDCVTQSRSVA